MDPVVNDFNKCSGVFSKRLADFVPYSVFIDKEEIARQISNMKDDVLIKKFIVHILEFKPFIDKQNDSFFFTENFNNKMSDKGVLCKQMSFLKKVWVNLDEEQRKIIFSDLQVLCKLAQQFFTAKYL
jgi:hypothetical protein